MRTGFEHECIKVTRAFFEDTILIKYKQIRAMSGAIGTPGGPNSDPEVIEGATTIYLEGELGFTVNHTLDEIIDMIAKREQGLN